MTDVFRKGIRQEYSVSASGGSENTKAYASVSYLNDKGYVENRVLPVLQHVLK